MVPAAVEAASADVVAVEDSMTVVDEEVASEEDVVAVVDSMTAVDVDLPVEAVVSRARRSPSKRMVFT